MSSNFEIEVLTKDLIHALNLVGGIVEKRTVKAILGNIKLDISDGMLSITATSADISMKISINGNIKSEGSTTVNHLTFSEIVRKISDETISLQFDSLSELLVLSGKSFTSNFATLPSDEFPALDLSINTDGKVTIDAKKLLRLIINSEFAMSTEETRYNLNGIFLSSSNSGELNAAAIDGHRLATVTEKISDNINFGIILPRKTVFEIIKILKDSQYSDEQCVIEFDNSKISFSMKNMVMLSKLVDAAFPDYKSLIPATHLNKLSIHSKKLMDAVDRVSTITHDKFRAIKFAIKKDELEISAFGETKGSAKESVLNTDENQNFLYEGNPISIGFNPKYMLDILKNFDNEEIEILLGNAFEPIVIKPVIHEEDRYIIMPMKV